MKMTTQHKEAIVKEVVWRVKKTSQNTVAANAQVSGATISQLKAHNWQHIADNMFRKVQSNLRIDLNWNVAETDNLKEVYHYCNSAQSQGMAICVSDKAGKGKSNGFKYYDRANANVIHLECKRSWSKKSFVKQLLIAMGVNPVGTTEEMLDRFNVQVKKMHQPLLIFDQADKLKDPQLDLFMEFYNDHEAHLGIILSGVKALEKRIDQGRQRNKIGYDEIYSRFGSKYISIDPVSLSDVTKICQANGVDNARDIQIIYDTCGGDLRRVRREIQISKLKNENVTTKKVA